MWFSHSDSRWDILSVIARNVYQKWQTKLCRDLQTYYIYGINPCVSSKMRYIENSNVRKIKQQQSANYGTWPKSGPRTFCSVGLQDFSTWRHIYLGYNFRRFPKQIDLGDWFFFLNIMPIVQPLPFMDPVHLFWEGSEGGTGGYLVSCGSILMEDTGIKSLQAVVMKTSLGYIYINTSSIDLICRIYM